MTVLDEPPYSRDPASNGYAVGAENEQVGVNNNSEPLARDLRSRHMQMIAIGGSIGAGLFVGSGAALSNGGPAPLVISYIVVRIMVFLTCQALAKMAVLYPVNGAFYTYVVRFIDPSWGFAMGWEYALCWLTILPFEITIASMTVAFWREDINVGIWIALFLGILGAVQVFGVRGYGEVEFVLSMVKITACVGFIILGIVIDCGGTRRTAAVDDYQHYLGAQYWRDSGAFRNGFNGFASILVVAAFAFGGAELVGLTAAESANPREAIPMATKQVFWRIAFVYVVNLFVLGLIVRSDDDRLLNSSGANTKFSPFVIAIQDAGIKTLPSVMNAVITVAVISVANACAFASTRSIQALAGNGMAPRVLAYVDKAGQPLCCVIAQMAFGFLAFISESARSSTVFSWMLALSGLSNFFVWGSIRLAHIRFRYAWKAQGYNVNRIPYRSAFGVYGSWIGLLLNAVCLTATFYSALYPSVNATPEAGYFFQRCLAVPIVVCLYLFWKAYSGNWGLYIPLQEINLMSGACLLEVGNEGEIPARTWRNLPRRVLRILF